MHAKVQHYVPQSYLKNFATKAKKGHLIGCFDKFTRKSFKPNIKNVASQTKFYDYKDSSGNEVSIENAFNQVETEAGKAFRTLIENPKMSVLLPYKETLAQFFVLQESRTQAFRDMPNDLIKNINQKLGKDGFSLPIPTEDREKEFQARFLANTSDDFVDVLLSMKWILLTNKTSQPFWTSDNPILKHNPNKSDLTGNLGLMCDGVQWQIPISPHLAIIICDPFAYAHEREEATATDIQNIIFNNSGQLVQSKQYVFSVDNDFQFAHQWIAENPRIADPNRSRIILAE